MRRFLPTYLVVFLTAIMSLAATASAVDTNDAIVQAVMDKYGMDPKDYHVEINSNQLKTRMVLPGDLTFRAFSPKEPLGPFTIEVTIAHEGKTIEEGQVRLRIRKYAEVVVANDRIGRHEELATTQFKIERMDVTSLREQPVKSFDQLEGQRTRRNLRRGTILTTGAIEPVPDIEVGGEVTILYADTWGTITAPGKALQDGWSGDRIRVKNLASNKIIEAEVETADQVRVGP
jgi:flagella basal body P-ring formation protein FlgA